MTSMFYLPRKLSGDSQIYTEAELLAASKFVVVLAEPGGGKTELMESLARQLGTKAVTATRFRHMGAEVENSPLVIDAFDELAKIDQSGIHLVLANACKAKATRVIISSRSSEWSNADTQLFGEFFGEQPLVVRLCEFDESDQQAIFLHHYPEENFIAFRSEVIRFELEPLLPNPLFLQLFAGAYIESDRHFIDKRSIFSTAVERLAKEANSRVRSAAHTLTSQHKIELAAEVFAKLLLSGAEGVSTQEAMADRIYPTLASLLHPIASRNDILATQLFKPGERVDLHRPVHKIVAEYCAAHYLTQRIADPTKPLMLASCFAVIAPNNTVRDELRGLLGWMAALGDQAIQEEAIRIDPYAVLANGDPSQLLPGSKRMLLAQLRKFAAQDPYFRRGDYWRRFSIAGFFTQDVADELKPLLATGDEGHLRDLILELLAGSSAIDSLQDELHQLALASQESAHTRILATRCLLKITGRDHYADLASLIIEASEVSLEIAAEIIIALGCQTFERQYLSDFLLVCATLYPGHDVRERTIGARYFIKKFIAKIDLGSTEWLLDELTRDLACHCGKKCYECDCRNGISKIAGALLDHYFDTAQAPFDPVKVWRWTQGLNFHKSKRPDESSSVRTLCADHFLRQGVIELAFSKLIDRDDIFHTRLYNFGWHAHSGLTFQSTDYEFIVDLAFEMENVTLWGFFIERHQYYRKSEERGANTLRRHMREQALLKPEFMKLWARSNKVAKEEFRWEHYERSRKLARKIRCRNKKDMAVHAANIKYIEENRALVESGRHWGWLVHFSELLLMAPDRIELECGDKNIVHNALINCLDFIAPNIPTLNKLAELQCASQYLKVEVILYAACIEIMRVNVNLEVVESRLLSALRTNINMGYSAISNEERDLLKAEVDRLIFSNPAKAENFIRQYLEPQLVNKACNNTELWLLKRDDNFSHLRASLSIEWLQSYPELNLSTLSELFDIAAQYGDRTDLNEIIASRCGELMSVWPSLTDNDEIEQKRTFWLLRSFYFIEDTPEQYWDWLKRDRDTVLLFYRFSSSINRSENPSWPALTAGKSYNILDAFIEQWPKVDLPSGWGSDSPQDEKAYRFLKDLLWSFNTDDGASYIKLLLADPRFSDFHMDLQSIYATQIRKRALRDFTPPLPQEIIKLLDGNEVVTVEGLRKLVLYELQRYQQDINGGEFNSAERFYEKDERLDEVRSTEIIAERIKLRLEPQSITVTPEHQLKDRNRSDFTVTKMIGGQRRLLVTEVKGQWHRELYTAASAQLYERYSIHPDAEQQGIFLVIWFGADEVVAGRKSHGIESAEILKSDIEEKLPAELLGLIDVFVLDVSRS
ncbi:NACHT domain-containing NTPase [Aeromonas caviae]|uniref:NACHT domain-containing protein n=1 Tax=Aeromonas caviae TaxID=648 RepID=UPI00214E2724|nr:ATP-binding protein [Aeromonas caviae]MCR3930747.1 ATP-binding protein [Aeromonas caviae]